VTYSGYQVQQNMVVPTCHPGQVRVMAEQYPPSKSKWETVEVEPGQIRIDWKHTLIDKPGFSDRAKPKSDFCKEDLERLNWPAALTFTHGLGGIACSGARPMVSAKTGYVSGKALLGRIYRRPAPKPWGGTGPQAGIWEKAWSFVDELLPGFEGSRLGDAEWLASMPSKRQKPLKRGFEDLDRYGFNPRTHGRFQAFVKTELLPGFDKDKEGLTPMKEMLDRLIQGPHDVAHCIVGPWVKPMVKKLKKLWHDENVIFYGSSSPEALHKWLQSLISDGQRQYFWCDFKMFDNTHSVDSWTFMEKLYRRWGVDEARFWDVMEAWRAPRGRCGPFKYQANVMNASGRDDTALANGVLNGIAMFLSITAAWNRVDVKDVTLEMVRHARTFLKLSVCGDDSLGSLPMVSEERMAELRRDISYGISQFGFEAKLFSSEKLYDSVYLGMRPYPTSKGWFWGKTIGRSTYKMGWALLKNDMDLAAHITGVADMHVLCSSHVPVLADLAQAIVRCRVGCKRTPVALDPDRPWEWTFKGGVDYDDLTLQAVADMYTVKKQPGYPRDPEHSVVTVSDVKSLISEIQKIKRIPCVVDHWLWRHIIWVDDL